MNSPVNRITGLFYFIYDPYFINSKRHLLCFNIMYGAKIHIYKILSVTPYNFLQKNSLINIKAIK